MRSDPHDISRLLEDVHRARRRLARIARIAIAFVASASIALALQLAINVRLDARSGGLGTSDAFGERPTPAIYFSYRDKPSPNGEIHIRAAHGVEQLAPDVRRVVRAMDPSLVVYDVRTLDEHIEKNLFLRRIPARMFAVLGPLLLLLAAIGIYAVVSYSISRRAVEIGVRHALGATSQRIVREIVGETLRTIRTGAAIGWLISLLVEIHVAGGVISLPIALGVPALLFLVAAIACWIPARRAAFADPAAALRAD